MNAFRSEVCELRLRMTPKVEKNTRRKRLMRKSMIEDRSAVRLAAAAAAAAADQRLLPDHRATAQWWRWRCRRFMDSSRAYCWVLPSTGIDARAIDRWRDAREAVPSNDNPDANRAVGGGWLLEWMRESARISERDAFLSFASSADRLRLTNENLRESAGISGNHAAGWTEGKGEYEIPAFGVPSR